MLLLWIVPAISFCRLYELHTAMLEFNEYFGDISIVNSEWGKFEIKVILGVWW